jgi:hypothetical protein
MTNTIAEQNNKTTIVTETHLLRPKNINCFTNGDIKYAKKADIINGAKISLDIYKNNNIKNKNNNAITKALVIPVSLFVITMPYHKLFPTRI